MVARKMIELANDVNAKFPDGKVHVSCYTCHRGKTTPDMVPPPEPPTQWGDSEEVRVEPGGTRRSLPQK